MTHQKYVPSDSQFRHNPSTDCPPLLHNHEDNPPPSSRRARTVINNGICSSQSRRRQLMEDNTRKTARGRANDSLTTQDFISSQSSQPINQQDVTSESPEAILISKELHRLCLSPSDLQCFWTANRDPPVTRLSLSELDLERISGDPRLHHDVNFDHEVSFRPNLQGEVGRHKLALAENYWNALVIEFKMYISRHRHKYSQVLEMSIIDPLWLPGPATLGKVRLRLPRMFEVINEILKTLVPRSEWAIVDARLDVELLIQELENGVCDIIDLSEWLGGLLQGSCSPMRDSSVQATVSTIRRGVENDNARLIVDGLQSLFGVLETMKLDVANHQIRTLRLLMVEDFVHFQQKMFLSRLPQEPNLRNAYAWISPPDMTEDQDKRANVPSMDIFLRGVVDLVATHCLSLPATFEYDFERLRVLQTDFQTCLKKAACRQIFIDTLRVLDRHQPSPPDHCENPADRISTFASGLNLAHNPSNHIQDIALEIVSEAYKACGTPTLPSEALLATTELHLRSAWDPKSPAFATQATILGNELSDLVHDIAASVADLTPLQLLHHLNPLHPSAPQPDQRSTPLDLARRIAHIAILHWRVWAPILYLQQPWGRSRDDAPGLVGSRQASVSISPAPHLNPISEAGPRIRLDCNRG